MSHNWEHSQRKFFSHLKQSEGRGKKKNYLKCFYLSLKSECVPAVLSLSAWSTEALLLLLFASRILALGNLGWPHQMHPLGMLEFLWMSTSGQVGPAVNALCARCKKRQDNIFLSVCTKGHTRKGHFRQNEMWSCAEGCAGFWTPTLHAL